MRLPFVNYSTVQGLNKKILSLQILVTHIGFIFHIFICETFSLGMYDQHNFFFFICLPQKSQYSTNSRYCTIFIYITLRRQTELFEVRLPLMPSIYFYFFFCCINLSYFEFVTGFSPFFKKGSEGVS